MDSAGLTGIGGTANPGSACTRKALIWGQDDLFTRAIHLLLGARTEWEVVDISNDSTVENLIRKTKRITPEVVILCREEINNDPALPLRLLREHQCLRVISMNLESNLVQVYGRDSAVLHSASDFLSVVDGSYFVNQNLGEGMENNIDGSGKASKSKIKMGT